MQSFGPGIWLETGADMPETLGFRYPTRMAVLRLADDSLAIWSPTTLTEALKEDVAALGDVAYILCPNTLHHLYALPWQAAFPDAKLLAPEGLSDKRPDLRIDFTLGENPVPILSDALDWVVIDNRLAREVVFFHRASGTVIFTDLLQQLPKDLLSGWRFLVAKLDKMVGDEPQVPRKFRVSMVDRSAARKAVAKIRSWPVERILMAHGTPVAEGAASVLDRAFAWLD